MKREIKIFKSFEEMDAYKLEQIRKTTPHQRFKNLFLMQQLSSKFHNTGEKSRKLTITYGYFTS